MQLEKLPSIWVESPLTIGYVSKGATIDRGKRFEFASIYYKDDPTKPKKKVDEFMFPEQILMNFRKNIRDASKSKSKEKKHKRKCTSQDEEEQLKSKLNRKANSITKRLYQKPDKLTQERDFFGNRCSMHQKQLSGICRLPSFQGPPLINNNSSSSEKLYITAAQRLDLSRPINFNPGPGSYIYETISQHKSILSRSSQDEGLIKRRGRDRYVLQSLHNSTISKDQ